MKIVDEKVIARVATALSCGAEVGDIREILLREGFSEYGVFLAVKAGEVSNRMGESS